MNFLKRAVTSITRRPGKSIILLLLIFILGTVISGAIAVDGAVSNTDANLRRGMRPIVTFQADDEAIRAYMEENGLSWEDPDAPTLEPLTPEMVREIGELPYVEHYEYSVPAYIEVPGFRNFSVWNPDEADNSGGDLAWLQVRGTSTPDLLQVREGVVDLVEGQTFTEEELRNYADVNPVILSAGFARLNNLSVGDIIEFPQRMLFPQPSGMWDENWGLNPENVFYEQIHTFQIIGLIDSPIEIDHEDNSQENQQLLNRLSAVLSTIHTSNSVAEEIARFQQEQYQLMLNHMIETGMDLPEYMDSEIESLENNPSDEGENQIHISSIMILNDPLEIDAFKEATENILPEFWIVESLAGGFDAISSSMETLQSIAFWVLVVSVGATLLILSLLITLFLRDRRYEMGVYLALGEKKGKIVTQILLEVVSIAVIGITLAVFTGNMISDVMSRNMLRNEIAAEQNSTDSSMGMTWNEFDQLGLNNEMSPEEMLEAFNVSLNISTIGLFYAVGLGAVIFSTIVPVVYVVTLNPKKVLM